ncbi:uncharacterized protein LOC132294408 [Cornus florida]|uniref:uncharacterized protein LOC132294408 n=1 Tax=Cornus florida TaxID=4283 RepID=UPI002898A7B7|nr:uncharacterized protein LOC132294408 [Cornus florida]
MHLLSFLKPIYKSASILHSSLQASSTTHKSKFRYLRLCWSCLLSSAMADEASQSLSLKVLVDEETDQVVFAESDNDFVDVLFSFMTMPIGNIIRLILQQAFKWEIGCLNNLYESIENLDDKHLQSVGCKDMLLRPRSAAEISCTNLKLDFVNCNTCEFYACGFWSVPQPQCTLCPYRTGSCYCGANRNIMWKVKNRISVPPVGGVFVKPTSCFMITDDFQVLPTSTVTCLTLLKELGPVDGRIKERSINIGKDEVLNMLKCSLTSITPFSETILESPAKRTRFANRHGEFIPRSTDESQRAMGTTNKEAKIALKLIINKCNNKALYVEAREDFANLISSFLTIPLGYVFKEFPCLSLKGCLANVYKSIQALDVDEFLISEEIKATLVNPKMAPGIPYNKQLIPIEEGLCP